MASERVQRRIDRLLDQAEEAMDSLNWDAVRDYAHAVLGLDPTNTDALAYIDSAQRVQDNQPAAVVAELQRAVQPETNPPPSPTAATRSSVSSERGGKKKVYLAQDTLLDREVAFALIKTEGLDEVSRTRITREA